MAETTVNVISSMSKCYSSLSKETKFTVNMTSLINKCYSTLYKKADIQVKSYLKSCFSTESKTLSLHKSKASFIKHVNGVSNRKGEGIRNNNSYVKKCTGTYKIIYPYIVTKFTITERTPNLEVVSS